MYLKIVKIPHIQTGLGGSLLTETQIITMVYGMRGWEGNYDLVKLNLRNEAVIEHIFLL